MSAVRRIFKGVDPTEYEVFVATAGGQLVAPGTAGNVGKVGPAAAGAVNCLGVAVVDGLPAGTSSSSTDPSGFPILNVAQAQQYISVAAFGIYPLNCAGTIALGDPIKCGAAGAVVKFVDGTDNPGLKIGRCVDPAGGVNGGTAACRLNIG